MHSDRPVCILPVQHPMLQLDALYLKQHQLDSMVQKTSRWLRELDMVVGIQGAAHRLNNLFSLSLCTRLSSLDIGHHQGIASLAPLSTLTCLKELRAHNTSISSIEPLRLCTQLTCLVISCTAVSCLDPLQPLCLMKELDMHGCTALTSLDAVGGLSRLLDLNLSHCRSLPPSALAPLASCTALKQLDIRACSFDLAPLASCHNLRRLYAYTLCAPLVNVSQLQGFPKLQIKTDATRKEWLDAVTLP
jgi:hypothetical protein